MANLRLAITSRFEWAAIAVIVAFAGIVFVAVEAQSERLAMTLALRNMRTGLQLAMAEKIMRGEDNSIADLAETNPLNLIGQPNGSGSGAWGDWQFDAKHRELVYRPTLALAFEGSNELRWHIVGVPGTNGRVTGLRLVEVLPSASHQ